MTEYPPGGPQPHPTATPVAAPKNGPGVASLVIAIVGLVTSFTVIGGVVLGIAAVVCGFVGRGRVGRGEADNGRTTVTGMVLGFLAIAAGLAFIVMWIFLWSGIRDSIDSGDYLDCLQKAGPDPASQQQCADEFNEPDDDGSGAGSAPASHGPFAPQPLARFSAGTGKIFQDAFLHDGGNQLSGTIEEISGGQAA
jgi:hypothetical protein